MIVRMGMIFRAAGIVACLLVRQHDHDHDHDHANETRRCTRDRCMHMHACMHA